MIVQEINYDKIESLKFTKKWNNKLYNKCFSTIRLKIAKYELNKDFEIIVAKEDKENYYGIGRVIRIRDITIEELTDEICLLDSGLSKADFIKQLITMYSYHLPDVANAKFYYMIVEHLELKKNDKAND